MKKLAKNIKRIGLIANLEKPKCRAIIRAAAALIRKNHRQVLVEAATAKFAGLNVDTLPDAGALTRHVDLLMVCGGDGTMLRVARACAGSQTPILGVNAGGLGFLTDVPQAQLPLALEQIFAGETVLETRPLIEAHATLRGQPFTQLALNDFVITRGAAPRLIELEVSVDNIIMTRYRCDGIIVCTPTGSTAYSLAAGGAVVSPTAAVLTITPICPHTLSNRSVIVSLQSKIQVRILSRRVETILTADGQSTVPLNPQDCITIQQSAHAIRLLHLSGSSFFETLRRKLNWSGSHVRHS